MVELCPECGEPLEYDEVDIGFGSVRGNYHCPSCMWTPQEITEARCPFGPNRLHTWSLSDGTQCQFCLRFKPDLLPPDMEGVDYGRKH